MTDSARDLKDRTFLITGANTGIGAATAKELARRGGKLILACRSEEKTRPVMEALRAAGAEVEFQALDLADLADVRRAAAAILAKDQPIHVLINNAGLAGLRGLTKDGFELTWGTNHLGPFLFTQLLLPRLRASAPARIVNVASTLHYGAKGVDFDVVRSKTATITGMKEYRVSKLCNILFTKELARGRAGAGVKSYSLHPGGVASDMYRRIPWPLRAIMTIGMITNEEGAKTSIYCATSPDVADQDGLYYDLCKVKKPSALAEDAELAKKVWEKSEELIAAVSAGKAA